MVKFVNLEEIEQFISELSVKQHSIQELLDLIKEQSIIVQSVILFLLDYKDEAVQKNLFFRESTGADYYELSLPFLNSKTYDLILDYSVQEYVELRSSANQELQRIAKDFIASRLPALSPVDKVNVLKAIIKDKIGCFYFENVFDLPLIQIELFKELEVNPVISDEKTKMAMEYSLEKVPLVLDSDHSQVVWILESQVVHKIESFWDSVKSTVLNLTKNTIGNPTFRKYAVAGLVLGLAVGAEDAFAGVDSGFDFDGVKDYFKAIDNYFNETVLPKHGFNDGCEVSSKIVAENSTAISAEITIGDRKILIDVHSGIYKTKGVAHATEGVKTEVLRMPNVKTTCNMSKETYVNLAKSISSQLSNFRK